MLAIYCEWCCNGQFQPTGITASPLCAWNLLHRQRHQRPPCLRLRLRERGKPQVRGHQDSPFSELPGFSLLIELPAEFFSLISAKTGKWGTCGCFCTGNLAIGIPLFACDFYWFFWPGSEVFVAHNWCAEFFKSIYYSCMLVLCRVSVIQHVCPNQLRIVTVTPTPKHIKPERFYSLLYSGQACVFSGEA